MTAPAGLLERLLDDRPTNPHPGVFRAHRDAWYGPLVGSLVVSESAFAALARAVHTGPPTDGEVEVTVLVEGGAGSLVALGRRPLPGLRLVAAVAPLRDLDDLAGNAARLAVAAEELADVQVHVGLPLAPGWVRAVEAVEAAGLSAALTATGRPATDPRAASALAEQLSVLVEADLPCTVSWPVAGPEPGLDAAALLVAVQALVDGAEPVDAADLLQRRDRERLRAALGAWDEVTASRVRRRLLSYATANLAATVAGLATLGVLPAPAT